MTRSDADTLDLVGMIFRHILDDPNLSDSVKSLLSHLHTPYLKLALMDNTFLDNYEHSTRLLINRIAEVGSKWVKDDNDRTVLPKIKTTIETVLKGFVDDVSIFDRLLADFTRFKENLEKRAKMVEKHNTESQQGLERLELSRERAADELNQRLIDAAVNDNIQALLRKPWVDFLAFNLLRHGDQSLTWQSALKVIDGVVWSVKPDSAEDGKEELRRRQEALNTSVEEGLATIGYDQEASKTLLNALKEAQELAYHGIVMDEVNHPTDHGGVASSRQMSADVSKAPAALTAKPVPPEAKVKAKTAQESALSAEEQAVMEKLKDIAFGTWFEFKESGKNSVQLKLAWFSRVTSHYMFVDHTGVKQAVETQIGLARGMCEGRVNIVELSKKSFMERALSAVLGKLKKAA